MTGAAINSCLVTTCCSLQGVWSGGGNHGSQKPGVRELVFYSGSKAAYDDMLLLHEVTEKAAVCRLEVMSKAESDPTEALALRKLLRGLQSVSAYPHPP